MNLMDLRSVYVANGTGIFILIILLFVSHAKILRDREEDRLYSIMCYGVIIGCFCEAFSYTIDGHVFAGSRILNYIANTYLYSFNLLLPLVVIFYVDLGLYEKRSRLWQKYKTQIIVGIAMVSLNIVNFFVPIIYYIDENNVYSRRPLSYLFYVAIIYYFVTAWLLERKYEKENGTRSFFNINTFLIPILSGVGLQFMFYGLSLAWLSSAVGLTGLYMMQQNEMAYIDPLVGTYNRQYLNHVLSSWTRRGSEFTGIMFDIDRFKQINDTCGHSEGDRALKTVTDILKNSRTDNEWVFRFAGDEFIVLKQTAEEDGMKYYLDEVRKRLDDYNSRTDSYKLSLSYGISYFHDTDLDAFMKEMDSRMYEMKKIHHETKDQ